MEKSNVVECRNGTRVGVVMAEVSAADRYCALVEEELTCERDAKEFVIAE